MAVILCAHCLLPQRGRAGVQTVQGYYPLCHSGEGMDCYELVTIYRHPIDNCACADTERWRRSSTSESP